MNNRDCWETPEWLFNSLDSEFDFEVDLCATEHNTKCYQYCDDIFEGTVRPSLHAGTSLELNFADMITLRYVHYFPNSHVTAFMNPPYSNPKPFIEQAWEYSRRCTIVCPLKVDPSTKWWAVFWDYDNHTPKDGCEIRFLPKRVKFTPPEGVDDSSGPYFASCIVIMDRRAVS